MEQDEECTHLYGVSKFTEGYTGYIFLEKDPEETYLFHKDDKETTLFRFCPDCGAKL